MRIITVNALTPKGSESIKNNISEKNMLKRKLFKKLFDLTWSEDFSSLIMTAKLPEISFVAMGVLTETVNKTFIKEGCVRNVDFEVIEEEVK